MAIMTHRTTFALDEATARRLKRLASRWKVSQAEVVRRSVEEADLRSRARRSNAAAELRKLHESDQGLDARTAKAYLAEVREDRKRWRRAR